MRNIFIICILVLFFTVACSTDKDAVDSAMWKLTKQSWKRSSTDKNTGTNPAGTILYSPVPLCAEDDVYTFNYSYKLKVDSGDVKCNAGEERITSSDFTIDPDNKKMVIKGIAYELAELSDSQLKLYLNVPGTSGFNTLIFLWEPVK